MEEKTFSKCSKHMLPVKDSLDILSGKWKLPIILSLRFGHKRFKEMERQIPGITARMLSKELKELEMNQLITRTVYNTTPVTVEYSLTKYGESLDDVLEALRVWGLKHRNRIINNVQ